ncbi:hypothetical protein TNCV_154301 [Trichonephila clavipes]|nr:hypothetical protein TNCV_154301 [Trichonephila clavipes]
MLNGEQQAIRVEMVGDNLAWGRSSLLGRIVIRNAQRCFLYDPPSKRTSAPWKSPQSLPNQKFRQDRTKGSVSQTVGCGPLGA